MCLCPPWLLFSIFWWGNEAGLATARGSILSGWAPPSGLASQVGKLCSQTGLSSEGPWAWFNVLLKPFWNSFFFSLFSLSFIFVSFIHIYFSLLYSILKFLIILSLNLCFKSKVQRNIHVSRGVHSACISTCISCWQCSKSPEFQWTRNAWEFRETASEYRLGVLCWWQSKKLGEGTVSPRRPYSPFELELASHKFSSRKNTVIL